MASKKKKFKNGMFGLFSKYCFYIRKGKSTKVCLNKNEYK
jgi:hypothetical protein